MKLFKRRQPDSAIGRRALHSAAEGSFDNVFQKGRTIAGGSPYAPSAPRKIDVHSSDRLHLHALVRRRRRVGSLLLIVLVITAGTFMAVTQFTAKAVVVSEQSSKPLDDTVYAEAIEAYMADNIKEHWRIFLDTDELTEYLQREIPDVKSVTVKGSAGFGKSLFEVTFRRPIASWTIGGEQLYVDEVGVPFSRNYFDPPALSITDQNTVFTGVGQSIASSRFIGFVGQMIGAATSHGYTVTEVTIPSGTTRQVEVKLTGVKYPAKLSIDRQAGEGVGDMVKAIEWFKAKGIDPQYIDVRVKGRAFYRT